MESRIIQFLRFEETDFRMRTLVDMLALSNDDLEKEHDVIQWMFPSDIKSSHNTFAPVLTPADIEIIQKDTIIQNAIKMSLNRMISFYENDDHWITYYNHNYKRLTRMLRCLWLAGLKHDYVCLQKALDDVYLSNENAVGAKTYLYWKNANNDSFMKNPQFSSLYEAPKRREFVQDENWFDYV